MHTLIIYIAAANWDTENAASLGQSERENPARCSRGSIVCGPQMLSEWGYLFKADRWRPGITNCARRASRGASVILKWDSSPHQCWGMNL
jgi:hypothetical protein